MKAFTSTGTSLNFPSGPANVRYEQSKTPPAYRVPVEPKRKRKR